MQTPVSTAHLGFAVSFILTAVMAPRESAQSGNWVATIRSAYGSADVTVAPRNDKQSLVKITVRDIARGGTQLSWGITAGRCLDAQREHLAPPAAFPLVRTQMDGSGTATAWVPKLESGKLYSVGVYFGQGGSCTTLREKRVRRARQES